jgi:hypothetical protein
LQKEADIGRLDVEFLGNALHVVAVAGKPRLELLLGTVESAHRAHQYNYNPTIYPNLDTVIAANVCSGAGDVSAGEKIPQ